MQRNGCALIGKDSSPVRTSMAGKVALMLNWLLCLVVLRIAKAWRHYRSQQRSSVEIRYGGRALVMRTPVGAEWLLLQGKEAMALCHGCCSIC